MYVHESIGMRAGNKSGIHLVLMINDMYN